MFTLDELRGERDAQVKKRDEVANAIAERRQELERLTLAQAAIEGSVVTLEGLIAAYTAREQAAQNAPTSGEPMAAPPELADKAGKKKTAKKAA